MLNSSGYVDQIQQAGSFRVNFSTLLVEDWTWPIEWEAYYNVYISTLDMVGIVGNRVLQQHGGDLPGIEANLRPLGPPICSISPLFARLPAPAAGDGDPPTPPCVLPEPLTGAGSTWRGLARLQHTKVPMLTMFIHVPKKTLTQTLFIESQ